MGIDEGSDSPANVAAESGSAGTLHEATVDHLRRSYSLSASGVPRKLVRVLSMHFDLRELAPASFRCTYFDTYDGRMLTGGECLVYCDKTRALRLDARPRDHGIRCVAIKLERMPRYATNLPVGALRTQLVKRTAPRALLPVTAVRVRQRAFLATDRTNGTRFQIYMDAMRAPVDAGVSERETVCRLYVCADSDQSAALTQFGSILDSIPGAVATDESDYRLALRLNRLDPAPHPARQAPTLHADDRADSALKQICLALLATLRANEPGIRRDVDAECLHDFRVALRRTRTALRQMKEVFPKTVTARFLTELAWLADLTGPARDLDVQLEQFDAYQASLPPPLRQGLEPLRALLLERKTAERGRLTDGLDSGRYQQLLNGWAAFLRAAPPRRAPPDAARPILIVASERLHQNYRKSCRQAAVIRRHNDAEAFHKLRKTCKKLRYELEFFRKLFPAEQVNAIIKSLKKLQDVLGDAQDAAVQAASLKECGNVLAQRGCAPETLDAIETLVAALAKKEKRAHARFEAHYEALCGTSTRSLMRKLFGRKAVGRYRRLLKANA